MTEKYDNWWLEGDNGDQAMEESHKEAWENIISLLDIKDIRNKDILDFGCNQGGFLRILYDNIPFSQGYGIDLASKAIEVAKARVGTYPIRYFNTGDVSLINENVDTVISTSVLYLIGDLDEHFKMMSDILKIGGVYYASFADQTKNPSFNYMKSVIDKNGATKMQDKTLDEIVDSLIKHDFCVELIKEYSQATYNVTNYKDFYLSVHDYIQSCKNSYLIKATKKA